MLHTRRTIAAIAAGVLLLLAFTVRQVPADVVRPQYEVRLHVSDQNFEAVKEATEGFAKAHGMEWHDDGGRMPPIKGRKVLVVDLIAQESLTIHVTNISPSGAYVAYFYGSQPKATIMERATELAAHWSKIWPKETEGPLEVRGRSTER